MARGQLLAPASSFLRAGDQLVAVDGRYHIPVEQITKEISRHRCAGRPVAGCRASTPVSLVIRRGNRLLSFSAYPRYDAASGRMRIGFAFAAEVRSPGVGGAAGQAISQMWYATHTTVSAIARIFEPKVRSQIHGVVGVFTVVNLFPFLPLDGGHVFWALAEKVRGRRIPFATMERAGAVGFVLILVLFVIGLSNDISTLTGNGFPTR